MRYQTHSTPKRYKLSEFFSNLLDGSRPLWLWAMRPSHPAGKPGELKMVLRTACENGANEQLRLLASHGPESADCGSGARGLVAVLADEDTAHGWWFRYSLQPLGVFPSSNRSSLTVGKAAVTFEDGVSGAADFVEVTHDRFSCSPVPS
jgi:hypothetical protein